MKRIKPVCKLCGDIFAVRRARAGYKLCLECGEEQSKQDRKSWCVATLHKSNSILITNREDLIGINNKGGLVR